MLTYGPGDWHVVATRGGIALLPPATDAADVARIWREMRDGDAFAVVLSVLLETAGPNMAALPDFAVATVSDGNARVIVRGAIPARVGTADGASQDVAALGVPTWTDRTIAGATTVAIGVHTASATALPLRDGVAAASQLQWVIDAATALRPADERSGVPAAPPVPAVPEPGPVTEPEAVLEPEPVREGEPRVSSMDTQVGAASELTLPPVVSEDAASADDPSAPPLVREEPESHPIEDTTGYDDLIFGETRLSSVEDAAVRPDSEAPDSTSSDSALAAAAAPPAPLGGGDLVDGVPKAPTAPVLGDHDGETISAEQLEALRAQLSGSAPVRQSTTPSPRTEAAVLVVSTGERVLLDRSAVVGRRPRAVRATGAVPHLVTVPSVEREISSNHVELRVEGADVIAVDLDTMNGTRLLRIGAEPVRLHPGEPTLLVTGDRLDLGDGVVLGFEGI